MAHSGNLTEMRRYAERAMREQNPMTFLLLLGDLHDRWHRGSRSPGFLLFHWQAIQYVKSLGLDQILNVRPYSIADFSPGGIFSEADWNSAMGSVPLSMNLSDLANYSITIEDDWHNLAHPVIAEVLNNPIMTLDFKRNVLLTMFWNLHFFVNENFERQLHSLSQALGIGRSPVDVIEYIYTQPHVVINAI